jgi:hypothetical protein
MIHSIEIKEKQLGCDRDNLSTIKELLGRVLGSDDGLFIKIDQGVISMDEFVYRLKEINMSKFNGYKNILFIINGVPYEVSPHHYNLGIIELIRHEI